MASSSIYEDGVYGARHPSWHEEHAPWKAAKVAAMLARNGIVPATIADVGCGTGGVLEALQIGHLPGTACWGFETAPQAFEACRAREGPTRHYVLGEPYALLGRPFDLVMALDVVEHVEDAHGFLRTIHPLGVRTILHVPLDLSVFGLLTRLPERVRASAGHLHGFTRETCLAMVEESGYRVLDDVYTRGAVEAPTSSWRTRAARGPRALAFGLHEAWAARLLGGASLLVLAE